jgi:hypothetical protein
MLSQEPARLSATLNCAEQRLLKAAAAGRRCGLEFGCGGSTGLLLAAGLLRLRSVDSDRSWLSRVAADPRAREAIACGRLQLTHIDIGPTTAWGWPACANSQARWPHYWRDPWQYVFGADLVFVDGRFRVACALSGLPHLAEGALLLVHDFWSRAVYRPPLMRHFELVGSAGTLAMLSARKPINTHLRALDLTAFALDPR